MKVVCITGGMGSGKSMVAKVIETLGYPVYYSDERAKQLYFLPEIKTQIVQLLGENAYLNEEEINKKYIASKIFSEKHLLEKINQIIHTAVKEDFRKFIEEHKNEKIIFKESALIFEAGLQNFCDKIILVTAPKDLRIQRIQQRDNLSVEEIKKRMAHQWEDDKKIPQVHFIIENDEQKPLLPQIVEVINKLKTTI